MGARASFRIAKGLRLNFSSRGVRASVSAGPFSYSAPLTSGPRTARVRNYGPTAGQLAQIDRENRHQARLSELSSITFGLESDGALWIRDANSQVVTAKHELDLIWREYQSDLQSFLARQLETFGDDARLLSRIHLDTPAPTPPRAFVAATFEEPRPTRPAPIDLPPHPSEPRVPRSLWGGITGANKRAQAALAADHANAVATWTEQCEALQAAHERNVGEWRDALAAWEARRAAHEQQQHDLSSQHETMLRTDASYANNILCRSLEALSWPREMTVASATEPPCETITLNIDLPEIEDFPDKVAQLHSSGRRLTLKNKSEKQSRHEYALHIHGVLLRCIGTAFWALPNTNRVVAAGYSQRLNKATGHIEDEYLLSVSADRENFSRLNFAALQSVDPIEALSALGVRRRMTTTHAFSKIEPHPL